MYINTVGTFGVASASHCWSRVSAAIGRITQYLCGRFATKWQMTVVLKRDVKTIVTRILCLALQQECRCLGEREQAGTL